MMKVQLWEVPNQEEAAKGAEPREIGWCMMHTAPGQGILMVKSDIFQIVGFRWQVNEITDKASDLPNGSMMERSVSGLEVGETFLYLALAKNEDVIRMQAEAQAAERIKGMLVRAPGGALDGLPPIRKQ